MHRYGAGNNSPWARPRKAIVWTGLAFALLPAAPADAQFEQQGHKLVGSGHAGIRMVLQGASVALSDDGNTAIVGGPRDGSTPGHDGPGAVWIYTRSNGIWTQQGPKLVADAAGADFGESVALSGDGNTAIVGLPRDQDGGSAWIYTRTAGVWTQQGPKLTAFANRRFGSSVALSGDGNTAIVGDPFANGICQEVCTYIGAAWVFTRSGATWTQQGPKLVGTLYSSYGANQGASVALSYDGSTAIVGGPRDGFDPAVKNSERGAVWVFRRSGGIWTQQGSKLTSSGGGHFGSSVALSGNGKTALIGAPGDGKPDPSRPAAPGAAWVFTRSGATWTQQGPKLVGADAAGLAHQGESVSLSGEGNTAIVGGSADDVSVGAAWVFTRSDGAWTQLGSKLVGRGADGSNLIQGTSVAMSGNGKIAIVGGSFDNGYAGAAWAYVRRH